MKFSASVLLGLALIAQTASAHYIFDTLIAGSTTSTNAVRKPAENSPITDISSPNMRCNVNTSPATETVSVAAGSKIGFKISNQKIYHLGPAAMYLGKAPGKAADWDGSGQSWFKIAEWGAVFDPIFSFSTLDKSEFTVTIPPQVPSGEYLVRIEQIALHQPGAPEFYLSCAQVKITDGGSGNPPMVSIPGHLSKEKDPGLTVDIYYPKPTQYTVPGPEPYFGFNDADDDTPLSDAPQNRVPVSTAAPSPSPSPSASPAPAPAPPASSAPKPSATPAPSPPSNPSPSSTLAPNDKKGKSCSCTCYVDEL